MNKNEIIKKYGTEALREFEDWTAGKRINIRINAGSKSSEIDYPKEYVEEFFNKEKKGTSRSNKVL